MEDTLQLASRYLSFVFLTAALTASAAPKAAAQEVVVTQRDHTRYYDRNHRDYHVWKDANCCGNSTKSARNRCRWLPWRVRPSAPSFPWSPE